MLGTDVKKSENGGVGTSALTIPVIVNAEARSSARKLRCGAATKKHAWGREASPVIANIGGVLSVMGLPSTLHKAAVVRATSIQRTV